MTDRTKIPDRDTPAAADAERAAARDVADIRTTGTKQDRSVHRYHTWLYDNLLA